MLIDRITKETTDISRASLDMSWWLDPDETITKIVSQKVILGMSGWSEAPYPPPGGLVPYDPFPLEIQSAVITPDGTQLEVFINEGSAGLAYTCQFVLDGSSARRVTIEMGVQVTGVPLSGSGSGPLPSYLAVTISDTPPSDPQPGQLWFDARNAQLYIWYDDGSSSQWVISTTIPIIEEDEGPGGPGPGGPGTSVEDLTINGVLKLTNLPTLPLGLEPDTVWRDGDLLKITLGAR